MYKIGLNKNASNYYDIKIIDLLKIDIFVMED